MAFHSDGRSHLKEEQDGHFGAILSAFIVFNSFVESEYLQWLSFKYFTNILFVEADF